MKQDFSNLLTPDDVKSIGQYFREHPKDRVKKKGDLLPYTVIKGNNNHLYLIIDKVLGQGDFGKVKLGVDLTNGHPCAIKKQKVNMQEKGYIENIKNLTKEEKLYHELDQLFSSTYKIKKKSGNLHYANYTVMPYYEGKSFSYYQNDYVSILSNFKSLSRLEKVDFLLFVFTMIQSLSEDLNRWHQKNIIHRDLHSENFLIDENGHATIIDPGRAISVDPKIKTIEGKTTDAGIAKLWSPEMKLSRLNRQKHNFSFADDIYGLGVTIMYDFDLLRIMHYIREPWLLKKMGMPLSNIILLQGLLESCIGRPKDRPTAEQMATQFSNLVNKLENCRNELQHEPQASSQDSDLEDFLIVADPLVNNTGSYYPPSSDDESEVPRKRY